MDEPTHAMEAPPSNPKQPVSGARARPPKLLVLGRTLIVLAAVLSLLLIGLRTLTGVAVLVASLLAFPVLIELRTLSANSRLDELASEPWGMNAIAVLAAGFAIVALSFVSPLIAWGAAWLLAGLLGVLGMRALTR